MSEEDRQKDRQNRQKLRQTDKLILSLAGVILVILIFNQFQLSSIKSGKGLSTGVSTVEASVIPTGIPRIYGNELGISYDDISANNPNLADKTIGIMGNLDYAIELVGDDLNRYINIVSQISCEYCCGAKSIIFDNGQPACGCAHSFAMRGLAKYLIKEHDSDFSDDEILEELAKWKTLYFPGQMLAKAQALKENGIKINYINLGSNLYRGIERGSAGGGMVGGC